jgi:hypothetical protein
MSDSGFTTEDAEYIKDFWIPPLRTLSTLRGIFAHGD